MYSPKNETTSISTSAISKALELLLEDLRQETRDLSALEQNSDDTHTTHHLLDERAQELEIILTSFSHHVRCKIADIRHRQNTLAPIYRLPVELLQHIFLLQMHERHLSGTEVSSIHNEYARAQNPNFDEDPPMKRDPKETPLETGYSVAVNIAAVSSHWYHIAVSTPKLWSSLDTRHSLDVIEILLERSMQTPLHIICSANVNDQHEHQFMELVVPYLHRWKSYDSLSRSRWLRAGFNVEGCSAPLLERWVLHGHNQMVADDIVPDFVFSDSPNLRDLHIVPRGYSLGANVLSGLTNLSIAGMIGEQELRTEQYELLFSASPKLETLFIQGQLSDINHELHIFSAKPPNLISLNLQDLDFGNTLTLLLSIFPNPNNFQVAKVLSGMWDRPLFTTMTLDHTWAIGGSVLHLMRDSMEWLSVARNSNDAEYMVIRGGPDACNTSIISLEMAMYDDLVGTALVSILEIAVPTSLTHIELELGPNLTTEPLLGETLHRFSQLVHFTITSSRQPLDLNAYHRFIEALSLPLLHSSRIGPQLKTLVLKGVHDLRLLAELFRRQYREYQHLLMNYGILRRLEMIEIDFFTQSLEDEINAQELVTQLAPLDIKVKWVPVYNRNPA